MKKEQIIGIIRHILTFAGGVIIAKGLATDAVILELIGSVTTLIGGVWSIVDKIKKGEI
jgi:hypothetical protein